MVRASKQIRRPRGRPRPEDASQIVEHLLDIATQVFVEHGYNETTIERIISAARISKSTLYSRYPDKRAVFAAVVQRLITRPAPFSFPIENALPVEEGLFIRARAIVEVSLAPELFPLYLLGQRESWWFPEVPNILLEGSRPLYLDALELYLKNRILPRDAANTDVAFYARLFQNAVIQLMNERLLMNNRILTKTATLIGTFDQNFAVLEDDIGKIVRLFLHGLNRGD
ncbi:MAG: TetR/AcrR family transcriptional regulator [Rhodospirillales bacterium]|nr:TetR/AcrR family transcriptional regulator [Rhodospirillales bacterium]